MRRELQLDLTARHLLGHLFDLRGVAVPDHAVGSNGFGGLRQQHRLLRHAASTGGSGFGVDDDAIGLDQPLLEEGQQGQQARGGKTTWRRHEGSLGDGRPMPLRQAVHGTATELGVIALNLLGFLGVDLIPLIE